MAVGIAGRPGGYWLAYGVDPGTELMQSIGAYVATRADNVTVAVQDLTTNQIYQFRPGVVGEHGEHTEGRHPGHAAGAGPGGRPIADA